MFYVVLKVLCRNLNSKMLTVGGTPAVQCMSVLLPCRWRVSRKGSSEIMKMAEFNEIELITRVNKWRWEFTLKKFLHAFVTLLTSLFTMQ